MHRSQYAPESYGLLLQLLNSFHLFAIIQMTSIKITRLQSLRRLRSSVILRLAQRRVQHPRIRRQFNWQIWSWSGSPATHCVQSNLQLKTSLQFLPVTGTAFRSWTSSIQSPPHCTLIECSERKRAIWIYFSRLLRWECLLNKKFLLRPLRRVLLIQRSSCSELFLLKKKLLPKNALQDFVESWSGLKNFLDRQFW